MNARLPGTAGPQTGRTVPKPSPHLQVLATRSNPPHPEIHKFPPRQPAAPPSPRDPLFESLRQELGL
jgi:hypothetical protein